MTRTIPDKVRMYELLAAGALGNSLRTWASPFDAYRDGFFGPFGIRTTRRGGPCWPTLAATRAEAVWAMYAAQGSGAELVFNEGVWPEDVTLNAEVCLTPSGLYAHYAEGPGHARDALSASGRHAFGLAAKMLLARHMGASGYDELVDVLAAWDGPPGTGLSAVAEVAATRVCVGRERKPWHLWEVRSY